MGLYKIGGKDLSGRIKMFLASYVAVLSVIRQPPIDFMFTPKFTQPRKKRELE